MSNTATVTPYESSPSSDSGSVGLAGAICVAGIAVVATAAAWLCEESEQDRVASARLAEARKRDLTDGAGLRVALDGVRVYTSSLHVSDVAPILLAAEGLGFNRGCPQGLQGGTKPFVFLTNGAGARLAVERTTEGRVKLHSSESQQRVQASVVRQQSMRGVIGELVKGGFQVQTGRSANGETQLLGKPGSSAGGAPVGEVRAQVRADGAIWVDIEKTKGRVCEQMVRDIADAVGGTVTDMRIKSEYYQLPGEPTRTKLDV